MRLQACVQFHGMPLFLPVDTTPAVDTRMGQTIRCFGCGDWVPILVM